MLQRLELFVPHASQTAEHHRVEIQCVTNASDVRIERGQIVHLWDRGYGQYVCCGPSEDGNGVDALTAADPGGKLWVVWGAETVRE